MVHLRDKIVESFFQRLVHDNKVCEIQVLVEDQNLIVSGQVRPGQYLRCDTEACCKEGSVKVTLANARYYCIADPSGLPSLIWNLTRKLTYVRQKRLNLSVNHMFSQSVYGVLFNDIVNVTPFQLVRIRKAKPRKSKICGIFKNSACFA